MRDRDVSRAGRRQRHLHHTGGATAWLVASAGAGSTSGHGHAIVGANYHYLGDCHGQRVWPTIRPLHPGNVAPINGFVGSGSAPWCPFAGRRQRPGTWSSPQSAPATGSAFKRGYTTQDGATRSRRRLCPHAFHLCIRRQQRRHRWLVPVLGNKFLQATAHSGVIVSRRSLAP